MRPGGEAKRIELESHPRPVDRATTGDADGGAENVLHGVNIAGNQNWVKPRGAGPNHGELTGAAGRDALSNSPHS
jgi:hypothetical protein